MIARTAWLSCSIMSEERPALLALLSKELRKRHLLGPHREAGGSLMIGGLKLMFSDAENMFAHLPHGCAKVSCWPVGRNLDLVPHGFSVPFCCREFVNTRMGYYVITAPKISPPRF